MTQSAADILKVLVGFNTVSDQSNLPLIEWVEGYLSEHGVSSRRIYDETGEKANLIATIGPQDVPGIVRCALPCAARPVIPRLPPILLMRSSMPHGWLCISRIRDVRWPLKALAIRCMIALTRPRMSD